MRATVAVVAFMAGCIIAPGFTLGFVVGAAVGAFTVLTGLFGSE